MSRMRVWWDPQVGHNLVFYVPVKSVEEAKMVMDILAAYDCFQYNKNIKGDYCNCGGLEVYNESEGCWEDWSIETEDDYFEDVDEYCETLPNASDIQEFTKAVLSQVSFD